MMFGEQEACELEEAKLQEVVDALLNELSLREKVGRFRRSQCW